MLIEVVADIEATDPDDGWTVLHRAVFRDFHQIVQLLLDKGANVNALDHKFWTPLHRAAFSGNTSSAVLLLKKGADVGAMDVNGQTPLHIAANAGQYFVVLELLRWHADVNAKDCNRLTPLDLVTKKSYRDNTVSPLLEALRRAKAKKDGVEYIPQAYNSSRRTWEPARPGNGPHRQGDNMPSYLVKKGRQPDPDPSDPSYWD
jgi:ankyrin repeat protein